MRKLPGRLTRLDILQELNRSGNYTWPPAAVGCTPFDFVQFPTGGFEDMIEVTDRSLVGI